MWFLVLGDLGKVELLGLGLGAQGWVCDRRCGGCGTVLIQRFLTTTDTKDITKVAGSVWPNGVRLDSLFHFVSQTEGMVEGLMENFGFLSGMGLFGAYAVVKVQVRLNG